MFQLNPRVDFAFKKLFGAEENKDILISFINAVVAEENRVADVVILNPYNHKDYPADKQSILDIKATDEQGRQYNIEMQITDQVYYNQRALYYWSKLYTSQLQQGNGFDQLKKTISINVLNFNYFEDEPNYHNVFKIMNVRSHQCFFEDLELHFIELEKFDKDLSHLKTALDRWANFLKKAHKYNRDTIPAELKQEPTIEKAMVALETLYLDDDEREIYEARLKWLRDEDAAIKKAHIKGIEQGAEENKRKIAANMLAEDMNTNMIAKLTGLPTDDIDSL